MKVVTKTDPLVWLVKPMLEGLDTLLVFVVIGAAIMLWQMFTDSTATRAAHVNYHPQEYYGE